MIIDKNLDLNRSSRAWFAVFDDDEKILDATKKVYARGVNIMDCFIPHPIHGMEAAMGIRRSRLPIVAFIMGSIGFSLALLMMSFMMVEDWPMIIGGKPHAGIPAWVPVTFECTVLFTAFGMMAVFFVRNRMLHGIVPDLADIGQTDNKYVIAMDVDDESINHNELESLLRDAGAIELKERKGGKTTVFGASSTKAAPVAEKPAEKVAETPKPTAKKKADKVELSEEEKTERLNIIATKLGERKGEEQDDLKAISGVGPKYEETLNSIGVYTYEQVSKLDSDSIAAIEELTKYFPGRIERDDWVGQAKKLMNK